MQHPDGKMMTSKEILEHKKLKEEIRGLINQNNDFKSTKRRANIAIVISIVAIVVEVAKLIIESRRH